MPPGSVLTALKPPAPPPRLALPPAALNDNVWHPKWAKKPKPLGALGRSVGYGLAFRALGHFGDQFANEIGAQSILNGLELRLGPGRVARWQSGCHLPASGCGPPWGPIWTTDGPHVCSTLCTIPTTTISRNPAISGDLATVGANRPVGLKVSFGYARGATADLWYFRAKEVYTMTENGSNPPYYTNRVADPGLLPNPFGDPALVPSVQPGTSPWPNLVPETQPVWQPAPLPAPLPFSVPRPNELPGVEPGYQPWKQPAVRPQPAVQPAFSPQPGVVVVPQPAGHVSIVVGGAPAPPAGSFPPKGWIKFNPTRGGWQHKNKKSPPKEHSTKGKGSAAVAAAVAYGAATETNDFIEAAWQAMGAAGGWQTKVAGEATTPATMVDDLFHAINDPHFDAVTFWAQLPIELGQNEAVDRGIGAVGSLGTAASRRVTHGRPVGYGFGGYGGGPQTPGGGAYDHTQEWDWHPHNWR